MQGRCAQSHDRGQNFARTAEILSFEEVQNVYNKIETLKVLIENRLDMQKEETSAKQ